jgi:hypothetical protein
MTKGFLMRTDLPLICLVCCGLGCGFAPADGANPGPGGTDAGPTPVADQWMPLAIGQVWSYQIHDGLSNTDGVGDLTVETFEAVGSRAAGTMAFRQREVLLGGAYNLQWEDRSATQARKYREQDHDGSGGIISDLYYTPDRLRMDYSPANIVNGAAYEDVYAETDATTGTEKSKIEYWTVVSADEVVTVPAGTFHAVHVHHMGNKATSATKEYWFVKGLGKIKETTSDTGDHEELISFTPAPAP